MPRAIGKVSDIDSCGLTLSELQELWLGAHPTTGSCFCTREELVAAWAAGRVVVMRLWGSHGRRPAGFYEFEWNGLRPAYAVERSTLWRTPGVLTEAERNELEVEWRLAFDAAKGKSTSERREHFAHHDVPDELVREWTAARRRSRRQPAPEKALDVASSAEGKADENMGPTARV